MQGGTRVGLRNPRKDVFIMAATKAVKEGDKMGVAEAAAYMGKNEMFVRQLLAKGRLVGQKEVLPGTSIPVWKTTRQACDDYVSKASTRTSSGGVKGEGKKYLIRVKFEDFKEVQDFLQAQGITMESPYASNYEYQKRKREEKRQANGAGAAAASTADTDVDLPEGDDPVTDDELEAMLDEE